MAKNDSVGDYRGVRKWTLPEVMNRGFSESPLPPFDEYLHGLPREDLGFREFWRDLQRHRMVVLATVLVITSIAAFFVLRTKSTYLASTVLILDNDSPVVIRTGERLASNDDSDATTTIAIKTKMVMMKSRELLEEVVVDLQLNQNPLFLDEVNPVGATEQARLEPLVNLIEKNLAIEQIRETRALKVSFTHTDPEIAAAVANGVTQHFIHRNFQNQTARVSNTSAWLDHSTAELKKRVETAEQALADYTRANQIFTTEGSSTLTTEKLAQLSDQVTRAETDRLMKETLYEEMKQGRKSEVPDVYAVMISESSPRIVELQKDLDELTANEAQLSVHFGPAHPQLQEVRQQMAAVKEQIETNRNAFNVRLRTEYEQAVRHEQSLKGALARAKAEAVGENQAAIQYNILKQEMETAKSLYTELLQASNQSKMQVAEQHDGIRIIDHARVPTVPSGPRRALNLLLWFAVSLLIGVGLAVLLEFLDNTIKNDDDVAQFLQLSTLAVIPSFKTVTYQLPQKLGDEAGAGQAGPTTMVKGREWYLLTGESALDQKDGLIIAEAYHALRTSLLLSTSEELPKTILVTSSQAGEGKTMTVVNLAFSLCELDARVLVIDADLRRPKLHQIFKLDHEKGLSTYLSRELPVTRLIQHLKQPRLSFLASGSAPPNPASLISSPKMKLLLEMLRDDYDYIVIDSPPCGGISDTRMLSTIVDGVILVVQGHKSRRDLVQRVRNDLMNVGARVIGVVLNNVNPKHGGPGKGAETRDYFKQAEAESHRQSFNQ